MAPLNDVLIREVTPSADAKALVPLVDPVRFIQATRDSGYRSLEAALSEIIDNALQSNARRIRIYTPTSSRNLGRDESGEAIIAVLDNGHGMTPDELQTALQFGGSHRFNDRGGLGRFGMGLPNSSLSQGRHVDVYTWQNGGAIWHSHLDLDDIVENNSNGASLSLPVTVNALPQPLRSRRGRRSKSGTLVIWRKLDRVRPLRWTVLTQRLHRRLGQVFRTYLWQGRSMLIDDLPIRPRDPLFLSADSFEQFGFYALPYGEPLCYQIAVPTKGTGSPAYNSKITVRFSELPVEQLTNLSSEAKRSLGIVGGAGVSVVRAGREIDFGWFLMDKRRENYDDWWRCEIAFSPDLDEAFGVTHTKQGIRPTEQLRRIMQSELGSIARALNRRVRLAHLDIAQERVRAGTAYITAGRRDVFLPPLPITSTILTVSPTNGPLPRFQLQTGELDNADFFRSDLKADGRVIVVLNEGHEFFKTVYRPLLLAEQDGSDGARRFRHHLELMLLALGRSQCLEQSGADASAVERFIVVWSRTLAVYCADGGTFYDRHDQAQQ